jgi:cob(I)alamin adenosyltransferase
MFGFVFGTAALYNLNMKITTKTGDRGDTSLFGGRRVSKGNKFIELVGQLDELQSLVGWCRCESGDLKEILDRIQDDIYRMMSIVGFEMKCPKSIKALGEKDVEFLEGEIESRQGVVEGLNKFIRPGTCEPAARLHIARSNCRKVERFYVGEFGEGDEWFLKYLNRLSDLLFILAFEKENY